MQRRGRSSRRRRAAPGARRRRSRGQPGAAPLAVLLPPGYRANLSALSQLVPAGYLSYSLFLVGSRHRSTWSSRPSSAGQFAMPTGQGFGNNSTLMPGSQSGFVSIPQAPPRDQSV